MTASLRKIWLALATMAVVLAFTIGILRTLSSLGENQSSAREKNLDPIIAQASARHGVPAALIKAVIWKESRFNAREIGSKGEIGLMQLTPGAVEEWRRANRQPPLDPRRLADPAVNIEIGTWYLAWTGRHWQDYASRDILQLAEYNAGYGRVSKLWKPADPKQEITADDISFPGTRSYIKQVLKRRQFYEQQHLEVKNTHPAP
ncbi:MAG: lytic transglycosylase domain-containing protein [Lentisphaeria bacterium]|nr:lytic transglycosylase domain-containing protein [Lentisphaeria bacterium]